MKGYNVDEIYFTPEREEELTADTNALKNTGESHKRRKVGIGETVIAGGSRVFSKGGGKE